MLMVHHIHQKALMQKNFPVSIHTKQFREVLGIIYLRKRQRHLLMQLAKLTVILNEKKPIMKYEDISLIADISLALSFLVAVVFGLVQLRQASRDRRERFTMEALRNIQTREFAEISGLLSYHKTP